MLDASFQQTLIEEVDRLSPDQQEQVLAYARALRRPPGVPGRDLLALAGTIPAEEAAEMAALIEAGCEQIDLDAW